MSKNRLIHPKTLDDMLLYALWHLHATAGRRVMRMCEAEFGISRREWRMVAQLAQGEGLPSSALAERAGLDRAQTSRAVGRLVEKKLLVRTPRQGNRREVQLHLTDEGRALYQALLPRVAAINGQLLSVLDESEVAMLEQLLDRLRAQADRLVAADWVEGRLAGDAAKT